MPGGKQTIDIDIDQMNQAYARLEQSAYNSEKRIAELEGQLQETNRRLAQTAQQPEDQEMRDATRFRPPKQALRRYVDVTGKEWPMWRQHVVHTQEACEYTDRYTKGLVLAAMDGRAAEVVMDMRAADPAWPSLAKLLDAIEERFLPPSASQTQRVLFQQARMEKEESGLMWHSRLRNLYLRAKLDMGRRKDDWDKDPSLIDRFVDGHVNPKVRELVYYEQPSTYTDALRSVQNAEALQLRCEGWASTDASAAAKRTVTSHKTQSTPMEIGSLGEEYGEVGALTPERPAQGSGWSRGRGGWTGTRGGKSCHICNSHEHLKRSCPWVRRVRESDREAEQVRQFNQWRSQSAAGATVMLQGGRSPQNWRGNDVGQGKAYTDTPVGRGSWRSGNQRNPNGGRRMAGIEVDGYEEDVVAPRETAAPGSSGEEVLNFQ